MRKIIPAFLVLILLSSCTHKIYQSLDWQNNKIAVDGRINEWPDPLRFFDEKAKLSYTIDNDLRNLYICMRVADQATKIKIIRGGMEFRIDTLGKKAFPVTLVFPVANQIVLTHDFKDRTQEDENQGEKHAQPPMKQRILSPANEFQLTGFKNLHNGTVSLLDNKSGISAAINIDSLGTLCYEAIIPFSTFYKKELAASDTGRVFSYEIKINALPAPSPHEGGAGGQGMGEEGMQGGGGRGGEGYGGGGHHQGGGMQGGGQRSGGNFQGSNSELFVTDEITQQLRFSFR